MKNKLRMFFPHAIFLIFSYLPFSSSIALSDSLANNPNEENMEIEFFDLDEDDNDELEPDEDDLEDAADKIGVQRIIYPLREILQYEIDSSYMMSQAIYSIRNEQHKNKLISIKNQYDQDIEELSEMIADYSGAPPAYYDGPDFRGFLMQGHVTLRGLFSDQGIMEALKTNTKFFFNAVHEALSDKNLPQNEREKIKQIESRIVDFQHYFEVAGKKNSWV